MTTIDEVIHLPDCPECGRPRVAFPVCTCGHETYLHDIGTRKGVSVRTACSNTTAAAGKCPCRMFERDPQSTPAPGDGTGLLSLGPAPREASGAGVPITTTAEEAPHGQA